MQSSIRSTRLSFPLALFLAAAFLPGQDVKTTVNPNQDFSKYKTYAWKKMSLGNAMVPDEVQRTMQLIKNAGNHELTQKGYWEDPENPDFYVEVATLGTQDVKLSGNTGMLYTFDGTVYNPQFGGAPGSSAWLTLTSQGQIVMTDRASKAVIWQVKTSKKYKNPDKVMRNLESEISSVVKKALKDFPARPGGKPKS
jgi:hypothetical protein